MKRWENMSRWDRDFLENAAENSLIETALIKIMAKHPDWIFLKCQKCKQFKNPKEMILSKSPGKAAYHLQRICEVCHHEKSRS